MPKTKKTTKDQDLKPKLVLVIRVRGAPHMNYKIDDTLKMLRLHKVNHAQIYLSNKTVDGMLKKAKDYIAYGEINQTVLLQLLKKRGLLKGNKPLTNEHVKLMCENIDDIEGLTKALIDGKIKYKDIKNIKPIFRLHPPRGGYRGTIKKAYKSGGTLGYVGKYINVMAGKML